MKNPVLLFLCLFSLVHLKGQTLAETIEKSTVQKIEDHFETYRYLHQNPELSTNEKNTSSFLKNKIRALGFTIIDSLGFESFAGILKNGEGPTLLYRTDMDGLPIKENTAFPFASKAIGMKGQESVPVMHACGHDIHMTTWLGVAERLTELKKRWKGTLILLAQSAEETGQGAKKAVKAESFKSIPNPDLYFAIHDHAQLKAGQLGFCDGYAMAAVDMMNIKIKGKGGHGAAPQNSIDPILIAAQFIQSIQSIVSRNINPIDPAIVTVGAIHGGTVGNIIPDQVELKLTIRTYTAQTRTLILNRIKTIGDELARAAGMSEEKLPEYELLDMSIPSVYNDPTLGNEIKNIIQKNQLANNIVGVPPVMIGEDFGVYAKLDSTKPGYLLWVGTSDPNGKNDELPGLHSASFSPAYKETLKNSINQVALIMIELFQSRKK
jgi:hippurate hydrolase